jgi:hypothetical protein
MNNRLLPCVLVLDANREVLRVARILATARARKISPRRSRCYARSATATLLALIPETVGLAPGLVSSCIASSYGRRLPVKLDKAACR